MQISIEWLAGFIDGEGCFSVGKYKDRFYFKIAIVSTNFEVLNIIQQTFGGKVFPRKKYSERHKNIYVWEINSRNAINLSKILKDKLIIKKQQAEIFSMIEIWDQPVGKNHGIPKILNEQRELAKTMMNELNKRGNN